MNKTLLITVLFAFMANKASATLSPRFQYQINRGNIGAADELQIYPPRYPFNFAISSAFIKAFAAEPSLEDRQKLERGKAFIEKIEQAAISRLYAASEDETGDERDIDVETQSSPAQQVAEYLIRNASWQGLFLHPPAQINWARAGDELPVPYHQLKPYAWLWRSLNIYSIEGESRLIGFPKFKKRPLTRAGKRIPSIGGDAGKGNFSVWTRDRENITSASFIIFYACRSHESCEKILRRQFKPSVQIEPITGYCDGGENYPYAELYRYYRLAIGGDYLFLRLYAAADDGAHMGEWGYTELEFYPKLDRWNIEDMKQEGCPLLPLIRKYPGL